ncbi:MAG: hypothetical protein KY468_16260 [Armatimonadetes bacterium]|nr:hypothetical protein [Armatimonadota bacterium]
MKPGEKKTLLKQRDGLSPKNQEATLLPGSVVTLLHSHPKIRDFWLVEDNLGNRAWVLETSLGEWQGQEDFLAQGEEVLYPAKGGCP